MIEDQYKWTQEEAIKLAVEVERIAPQASCHVALTGGTLYKDGLRKDIDLLFYKIRQVEDLDKIKLGNLLSLLGFELLKDHGFVWKAKYKNKQVDLFFPDHSDSCNNEEY